MGTHSAIQLNKSDFESILQSGESAALLDHALQRCIDNPQRLAQLVALYVAFNAPFAAGVASLSGAIASRPDLFRDPKAPHLLADRATEVARRVHDAVIDEFLDRTKKLSHRTLAQAFLKMLAEHVGADLNELDRLTAENSSLATSIREVKGGYGIGDTTENAILFGIGWHMGSEVLADEEFNRIDAFLRHSYPDLVRDLLKGRTFIGTMHCPGYFWIQIHTSVEKDHFQLAAEAAQMALEFYTGDHDPAYAKQLILDGFEAFSMTQHMLLAELGSF